jgi:ABC-type transport system substrate-binding protein
MSSEFNRRSFLTHSAATLGGVAMAGTVVDGLLASSAGATTGVSAKKPRLGGTLAVGLVSDVPDYHVFNGAQGKMDQSGFCVANALYDALFVSAASGKGWLPMLALSATPNKSYTVWTVAPRRDLHQRRRLQRRYRGGELPGGGGRLDGRPRHSADHQELRGF